MRTVIGLFLVLASLSLGGCGASSDNGALHPMSSGPMVVSVAAR